jgi:hypothetical protein
MGFVPIAPVVIEILKLAISPGVLPLTLLLVVMGVFWMVCLLGAFDLDLFTFDARADSTPATVAASLADRCAG